VCDAKPSRLAPRAKLLVRGKVYTTCEHKPGFRLKGVVSGLKMSKRAAKQFFRRYADIAVASARIPVAAGERRQQENASRKARYETARFAARVPMRSIGIRTPTPEHIDLQQFQPVTPIVDSCKDALYVQLWRIAMANHL
jgi:hypothetical protein